MAALLTIESQNTDKLALYLGECRELGVPVLPPDVNASELAFTVRAGDGVRFGLGAVKNVGEGAIESMLGVAQGARARSTRSYALCEHVDLRLVNKRVLESLIKAGALDSLRPAAGRAAVDVAARRGSSPPSTARSSTAAATSAIATQGQAQLFGGGRRRATATTPLPRCPTRRPGRRSEQLAFEKEALGLYMSGHPLERYRARPDAAVARDASRRARPTRPRRRRRLRSAASSRPAAAQDAKGDRMAVFMLEDVDGSVEVVVFPEAFKQARHADRGRRDGAGARQARRRRRVRARSSRPRSCRSTA